MPQGVRKDIGDEISIHNADTQAEWPLRTQWESGRVCCVHKYGLRPNFAHLSEQNQLERTCSRAIHHCNTANEKQVIWQAQKMQSFVSP